MNQSKSLRSNIIEKEKKQPLFYGKLKYSKKGGFFPALVQFGTALSRHTTLIPKPCSRTIFLIFYPCPLLKTTTVFQ